MFQFNNAGLNPCCSGRWSRTMMPQVSLLTSKVLILVVVDDGLVRLMIKPSAKVKKCLNPCCSGRWSRTSRIDVKNNPKTCLNPCCSGRWSRTGYVGEKYIILGLS